MGRIVGGHAVVLGASMAGLLTARVLAESFERVTVIERDRLPTGVAQRRGVPQGHHIHALLARGAQVLDGLFPGLTAEIIASGAPTGDLLGGIRWFLSGHRIRQADIGQPVLFPSRPLLESGVRDRVRALPNVRVADGLDVVVPTTTADRCRVTGVRVRDADGHITLIDADLVVDATGRGSRTPLWLESWGYTRPRADQVHVGVCYTSRAYRLPPGALGSDALMLHSWHPGQPRGAGLVAQEGERYLATQVGMLGDQPPTELEGFLAFARSLPFDDIYTAIRDGEPLGKAATFQYPANVRHRYERLSRFPDGLFVLGDAVCGFNPIYGQGMTVAALQAAAFGDLLAAGRLPTSRRYFQAIAKVVDAPWEIATGSDLAFPEVTGRRTARTRMVNAYLPRLHAAAATDASLGAAFVRVTGLLAAPTSLLRPDRVLRVLLSRDSAASNGADAVVPPPVNLPADRAATPRGQRPAA
ncbi:NAD(P)/FAD-dependent oxidoreductase [Plantactinospora sp. BC1]|uniref:FAD-dependent oxidoreductase n=1 Tax=Plantactinospora sp. BC1 TaxID=2108470 RepID=UPI0018FE6E3D|nr:FAD-binding monooxygenase [Plantactinospora sp. BC1]